MESVWDYPRPPAAHAVRAHRADRARRRRDRGVRPRAAGAGDAATAPTLYLPLDDVAAGVLAPAAGSSFCEFKGRAVYFDVAAGGRVARACRLAPTRSRIPPTPPWLGHVSFYPGRMDACWLGEERVRAQAGDFYGGWITADLAGPFKGPPGTRGW